jgi:uncharacterized protein YkwD
MFSARSMSLIIASTVLLLGAAAAPVQALPATAGPAAATSTDTPVAASQAVVGRTVSARAATLRPALQRVLNRVNRVRANHGRKPLRAISCLTDRVAQPWARHMAQTGSFEHQDLTNVFKTCSGLTRVGENIAVGYPTAKSVMKAWMHSKGHRRNILDGRFRKIGLGLARSADGTPYWVQDFGR